MVTCGKCFVEHQKPDSDHLAAMTAASHALFVNRLVPVTYRGATQ